MVSIKKGDLSTLYNRAAKWEDTFWAGLITGLDSKVSEMKKNKADPEVSLRFVSWKVDVHHLT